MKTHPDLLKIYSAYLPYKLMLTYTDVPHGIKRKAFLSGVTLTEIETTYKRKIKGCSGDIISWTGNNNIFDMNVKPVLRPLRDFINNPTEWDDLYDEFSEMSYDHFINSFFVLGRSENCMSIIDYEMLEKFLGYHFDIFGLIDLGLAVDINKIK